MKDNQIALKLAEAQFIGYVHAYKGFSAKSLAEGMGLKKSEWKELRDKVDIPDVEKREIDFMFYEPNPAHWPPF